jgi:hypothetical protein
MPRFHVSFSGSHTIDAADLSNGYADGLFSFPLPTNIVPSTIHVHDLNIFARIYRSSTSTHVLISDLLTFTFARPYIEGVSYVAATDRTPEGMVFSKRSFFQSLDVFVNAHLQALQAKYLVLLKDLEILGFTPIADDVIFYNFFLTCSEYTRETFYS